MCSCFFVLLTLFCFVFHRDFFYVSGATTKQHLCEFSSGFNEWMMDCYNDESGLQDGDRLYYRYSNANLRKLRNNNLKPNRSVRRSMYWLGILRKQNSVVHNISTIISSRRHRHANMSDSNSKWRKRKTGCDNITIPTVDFRLPVCITANILTTVKKVDEIEAISKIYNPQVINFCETWLNS
jgi:hypothetical protein